MTDRRRSRADYEAAAAKGMTARDAAISLGVGIATVQTAAHRYGLTFAEGELRRGRLPTSDYIAAAKAGMTRHETAIHLGVTRAAVDMVALRHGVEFTPDRNLRHKRTKPADLPPAPLTRTELADVKVLVRRGGFSREEAIEIVRRPRTKVKAASGRVQP